MGKTKLNAGRKEVESERSYVASLKAEAGTLPAGHEPHGKI